MAISYHFLLFSIQLVFPVMTVNARIAISPSSPVAEVGSNVNISCTIEGESNHTAHDLVWFHNNTNLVTSRNYYPNSNISVVSLQHVGLDDGGFYYCCLPRDNRCNSTRLSVGVPPGKLSKFVCSSNNINTYWCEWDPVVMERPSQLVVSYKFLYRVKMLKQKWYPCPDYTSKGENTCYISFLNNGGFQQQMKVISTNALGSRTDKLIFNPDTQTIPNPPSINVVAMDSHTIMVTWTIPQDWEKSESSLKYKLRYKAENSVNGTEIHLESSPLSYEIQNLKVYTNYCVAISAVILLPINEDDYWSDWSMKCVTTHEAVPIGVVNVRLDTTHDSPDNKTYIRDVALHWEDIPTKERHGIILGYIMYVKKAYDAGSGVTVYNITSNRVILKGLEKFSEYTVYTQAYNTAGMGPYGTFKIDDLTSKPDKPNQLQLSPISHNKMIVSWMPPTKLNGVTQFYSVQYRQSTNRSQSKPVEWTEKRVTNISTMIEVGCYKDNDDGVMFDVQVSAVNKATDGSVLKGQVVRSEYKMCQQISVFSSIMPVLTSLAMVVVVVVLVAAFAKKAIGARDIPEPKFIYDRGNIACIKGLDTGHHRFHITEPEIFDEPLSAHVISSTDSVPITEIAEVAEESTCAEMIKSKQTFRRQSNTKLESLEHIKTDPNMHLKLIRSVSTDSGVPPSPLDPDSGDTMCQDDCFSHDTSSMPFTGIITSDESHGNMHCWRSEQSNTVSHHLVSDHVVDSNMLFSFCNDIYMRQSNTTSRRDLIRSISFESNKTAPSSGISGSNSKIAPSSPTSDTMIGPSNPPSDTIIATSIHGHFSATPNVRSNDPYMRMKDLTVASAINLPLGSPDDTQNASPYIQAQQTPTISILTTSHVDNLPYFQVGQLATNFDSRISCPTQNSNTEASMYILHSVLDKKQYAKCPVIESRSPTSMKSDRIELTSLITTTASKQSTHNDENSASASHSQLDNLPENQDYLPQPTLNIKCSTGLLYNGTVSAISQSKETNFSPNYLKHTSETVSNSQNESNSDSVSATSYQPLPLQQPNSDSVLATSYQPLPLQQPNSDSVIATAYQPLPLQHKAGNNCSTAPMQPVSSSTIPSSGYVCIPSNQSVQQHSVKSLNQNPSDKSSYIRSLSQPNPILVDTDKSIVCKPAQNGYVTVKTTNTRPRTF